jgi:hypothetical protein
LLIQNTIHKFSVADPGCLSRILDPNFSILEHRVKKIPDPGSGSMNLSILNLKTVSKLTEQLSGMFIPDLDDFLLSRIPNPDPRSRGQKTPVSGSGSRNTA